MTTYWIARNGLSRNDLILAPGIAYFSPGMVRSRNPCGDGRGGAVREVPFVKTEV